jgi:hypothetical protein
MTAQELHLVQGSSSQGYAINCRELWRTSAWASGLRYRQCQPSPRRTEAAPPRRGDPPRTREREACGASCPARPPSRHTAKSGEKVRQRPSEFTFVSANVRTKDIAENLTHLEQHANCFIVAVEGCNVQRCPRTLVKSLHVSFFVREEHNLLQSNCAPQHSARTSHIRGTPAGHCYARQGSRWSLPGLCQPPTSEPCGPPGRACP